MSAFSMAGHNNSTVLCCIPVEFSVTTQAGVCTADCQLYYLHKRQPQRWGCNDQSLRTSNKKLKMVPRWARIFKCAMLINRFYIQVWGNLHRLWLASSVWMRLISPGQSVLRCTCASVFCLLCVSSTCQLRCSHMKTAGCSCCFPQLQQSHLFSCAIIYVPQQTSACRWVYVCHVPLMICPPALAGYTEVEINWCAHGNILKWFLRLAFFYTIVLAELKSSPSAPTNRLCTTGIHHGPCDSSLLQEFSYLLILRAPWAVVHGSRTSHGHDCTCVAVALCVVYEKYSSSVP